MTELKKIKKLFFVEKEHIEVGYRAHDNMTVGMCCKSMCQIHNETGNIYTHFLPALYTLYQTILLLMGAGCYAEFKHRQSFWVQFASCVSIMTCMSASSVYHTFNPLSSYHFYLFLKIDLIGIGIMIFGLTLAASFIGFHNWPFERDVVMGIMGSFMVSNLLIQMTPCYA